MVFSTIPSYQILYVDLGHGFFWIASLAVYSNVLQFVYRFLFSYTAINFISHTSRYVLGSPSPGLQDLLKGLFHKMHDFFRSVKLNLAVLSVSALID
jgi:hypothetical protein